MAAVINLGTEIAAVVIIVQEEITKKKSVKNLVRVRDIGRNITNILKALIPLMTIFVNILQVFIDLKDLCLE